MSSHSVVPPTAGERLRRLRDPQHSPFGELGQRLRRHQQRRAAHAADVDLTTRLIAWTLSAIAGLAVWLVLFALVLSPLSYQHHQHGLYTQFRSELAGETAPLGDTSASGAPVALLTIPKAGVHGVVVAEGTDSGVLEGGPGHLDGSPLPGQAGVSVILGRGISYGAPFGDLTSLHDGDTITATTQQGTFHYVVVALEQGGHKASLALPSNTASLLTLVTTAGSGWRSGWAPNTTIYVWARLEGKADPSGALAPSQNAQSVIMKGSSAGLYPMVLWLQLLIVAVIAIMWGRNRWGRWQSWLAGMPIVLAALWGASGAFWLLVPNLV